MVALVLAGLFLADREPGTPTAKDPAPTNPLAPDDEATRATDDAEAEAEAEAEALAAEEAEAAEQQRVQRVVARKAEARAEQVDEKQDVAARVARREARLARIEALRNQPFDVRVGSFNVLGSQHTGPGGPRPYPAASTRSVGAANLMAKHGVDIVGTQELQDDQLRAIQGRTGMAAYPGFAWGSKETDNSILYDDGRFEMIGGDRFTITFMGRPRPQPILKLRVRETGREFYVVNTHPSAGGGRYAAERARGRATLIGVVNGLKSEGLPVFVTGDMNDREPFFCQGVAVGGLVSSSGGSYGGGCNPPPGPIPVDWVVSTPDVSWTGYWRDTAATDNRISDHFFISAMAHVG